MFQALSKAKLTYFRKFQQKKTREQEGMFLIEGWHLIEEATKAGRELRALIVDQSAPREAAEDGVLQAALQRCGEAFAATSLQTQQLSDTRASQGVLALVDQVGLGWETFLSALSRSGPLRLVALDDVGDPGNSGSIVRSCDWFGLDGVIFGQGCAELENGKTARATMGGLFHLPVAVGVDLPAALQDLRGLGVSAITAELDAEARSLADFRFPERAALVIGSEARGVSAAVSAAAEGRVYIPRFGRGESLNAAAAAAVCLGRWRL